MSVLMPILPVEFTDEPASVVDRVGRYDPCRSEAAS